MFALASKPAQHSMFDSPNAVSLVRDYTCLSQSITLGPLNVKGVILLH